LVATGRYDPANLSSKNPDKKLLAALSRASITDFVPAAQEIIAKNKPAFDLLCSAMRQRYPDIREQIISSGRPGIYPLLVKEELNKILADVIGSGVSETTGMAKREPVLEFRLSRPKSVHCSFCGHGPDEGAFVITGTIDGMLKAFRSHVERFHPAGGDINQAAARTVRKLTEGK
jgi:hypothetical protein